MTIAERAVERLCYLDAERLDIIEGIKTAADEDIKRWLYLRLVRNTKTVYAMFGLLKEESESYSPA